MLDSSGKVLRRQTPELAWGLARSKFITALRDVVSAVQCTWCLLLCECCVSAPHGDNGACVCMSCLGSLQAAPLFKHLVMPNLTPKRADACVAVRCRLCTV